MYNVTLIPGDGTGPEIADATRKCIDATGVKIDWDVQECGIEVIERRIMPEELSGFSECFITGTAAEITAVSEIAQWKFTPGAITRQLADDYTAEVQPKGKAAAA